MQHIGGMSKALMAFYDAAYLQRNWVKALDAIASMSAAKGVMMYASDQSGHASYNVNYANSLYADKGADIEEYQTRFMRNRQESHDLQGITHLNHQPAFKTVLDTDIWTLRHLNQVPEVQFAKERVGVFRRANYNLSETPDLIAGLILQYDTSVIEPPRSGLFQMPDIVRHVGKAITINRLFDPLAQKYNAVLSMLDKLDLGVCLLDQYGRVAVSNKTLRNLLDLKDGILISPEGRIRCHSDDLDGTLQGFIKKVSLTSKGEGHVTDASVLIARRTGLDPILAIVSPLRDADGEIDHTLTGCMVAFVDASRRIRVNMEAFGLAFGLTLAEKDVSTGLRDGLSTNEIAERRSVSKETVATQIKAIFAKTNTRNRVQLVWKMVQFAPPVL